MAPSDPTPSGMAGLQRALAIYCAWLDAPEPRPSAAQLLAAHPAEADLLEPMLEDEDVEAVDAERAEQRTVGNYRIVREIGRGGMGVVYEAVDSELGRTVALKVLPAQHSLSPTAIARFQRESNLSAKLEHPGIVRVFAVGHHAGEHFFAMELLRGAPLDRVLAHFDAPSIDPASELRRVINAESIEPSAAGRPTTDPSASTDNGSRVFDGTRAQILVRVALQIADALAYAHAHGVLHRDIKPANAILHADGRVVLTDFGLAREGDAPGVTRTGHFAGTPEYSSPEQLDGAWERVGPPADIWSLGVTLYEMLAGRRPFAGDDLARQVRDVDPPRLDQQRRDISEDLAAVVHKALEKDPLARYGSANELAVDLRAWLEHRPVSARRLTGLGRLRRWVRRAPVHAALAAVLVLGAPLLAALGGYVVANAPAVAAGEAKLAADQLDAALDTAYGHLARGELGQAIRGFSAILADHADETEALAGQFFVLGQLQDPTPLRAWCARNADALARRPVLRAVAEQMRRGNDQHTEFLEDREGWTASDYSIAGYFCMSRAQEDDASWLVRAARMFQQAALDNDRLHHHCAWARAAKAAGLADDHAASLEGLQRLFPDRVPALLVLAETGVSADDSDDSVADAALDRALQLAPEDPDVRTLHARAALDQGELERARARIDTVLRDHPEHLAALVVAAQIVRASDQPEAALAAFERAAASARLEFDVRRWLPRSTDAERHSYHSPIALHPGQPDLIVDIAMGLAALGAPEAAMSLLARCRALRPTGGDPVSGIAQAALHAGHTEAARAMVRARIEAGSEDPLIYLVEAKIASTQRDDEAALRAAARATELDPDLPVGQYVHAITLNNLHRFGEARDRAERAVALDPLSERPSRLLRGIAIASDDMMGFIAEIARFAVALRDAGKFEAALAAADELAHLEPPTEPPAVAALFEQLADVRTTCEAALANGTNAEEEGR